jgi:hypothetical protein
LWTPACQAGYFLAIFKDNYLKHNNNIPLKFDFGIINLPKASSFKVRCFPAKLEKLTQRKINR